MKQLSTSASNFRVASYVVGFILSVLLTLSAYLLVSQHTSGHHTFLTQRFIIGTILVLAMVQLIVQLIFFLHLGREAKPRWNLQVLIFAAGVVLILVLGSLWIMANLDYHHGNTDSIPTDASIIEDEIPMDSMSDHHEGMNHH